MQDSPASAYQGAYMAITCAILQYDPGMTEEGSSVTAIRRTVFPVLFQVPSTSEYMNCTNSKINVESVRWPHTRFTAPERPKLPLLNLLKGSSCLTDRSCSTIDAAVWVTPLCGGGSVSPVCLKEFVKAACFPYCLAVRQANSFNSAIRLYNAPDWTDRVHLFNRDCALFDRPPTAGGEGSTSTVGISPFVVPQSIQLLIDAVLASWSFGGLTPLVESTAAPLSGTSVESTIPSDWVSSVRVVDYSSSSSSSSSSQPQGDSVSCIAHEFARSTIPTEFISSSEYGENSFRSTLATGQPFVFAGDTMLVADCSEYNDNRTAIECKVLVYRIYGGDDNQMTLVRLWSAATLLMKQQSHSTELSVQERERERECVCVNVYSELRNHCRPYLMMIEAQRHELVEFLLLLPVEFLLLLPVEFGKPLLFMRMFSSLLGPVLVLVRPFLFEPFDQWGHLFLVLLLSHTHVEHLVHAVVEYLHTLLVL